MSRDDAVLWRLAANFAVLSLFAIGGVNALLPEIQRQVVDTHGWMSNARFADLFAIAQAAPGPNFTVVTLIGWDVAGASGALVSTLAMVAPTSLLAYGVGRLWTRFRDAPWRSAAQRGLAPVTIGLVAASAYILTRSADAGVAALALSLITAACLYATRLHPILFLAIGAALGALGLL